MSASNVAVFGDALTPGLPGLRAIDLSCGSANDISAAATYLEAHHIRVVEGPVARVCGPGAGETWLRFLTPRSAPVEHVSFPSGRQYEHTTTLVCAIRGTTRSEITF